MSDEARQLAGVGKPSPAETLDRDTRDKLLEATDRLVRRIGMAKTSMADVARSAGVARGTLYRYFDSRDALFDALNRHLTERFFEEVTEAMDRSPTLSEQLGEFSQMMIRAIHPDADDAPTDQAGMVRMLATEGTHALRRTAKLLRPYIEKARERGEVRRDLDITDASEWLARVLLSFTIFQASLSYEADDPTSVSSFVRRYAIRGLSGE